MDLHGLIVVGVVLVVRIDVVVPIRASCPGETGSDRERERRSHSSTLEVHFRLWPCGKMIARLMAVAVNPEEPTVKVAGVLF